MISGVKQKCSPCQVLTFGLGSISALGVELLNQFQAGWPANLHLKYSTVLIDTMNTILSLLSLTVLIQASEILTFKC